MPSAISTSTTSASSLLAIQCAAVAPTFPAPMIETFLRMYPFSCLHVRNDQIGEPAGADLGGAFHLALEIVGDCLVLDGERDSFFDELRGFRPSEILEHHHAREDDRAGVDDIFVRVLGGGAVGGFEDGVSVTKAATGGNAQSAHLR